MRVGGKRGVVCGGLIALVAAPLAAAGQDPVATRIAGLRQLGAAFKNINDALKGPTPQPIVLQISARQLREAARAQYGWFPAGSGPAAGVKTNAKPEIWAQPAQFKAAQDAFAAQADAFARVAASGNADAMRAQAKAVGATCAACHRAFRTDTQ